MPAFAEQKAEATIYDLRDLGTAAPLFNQLLAENSPIEVGEEESRRLRKNTADIKAMQGNGDLQPGETYIGMRIIDQNINNALPPLLAYLKNSPRMATFSPGDNSYLDNEFTRMLQYSQWEVPYIKTLDSAEQNGLGYMMVKEDITKLGKVSFENFRFSDVIYDRRVEDIQDSPAVLCRHTITAVSFYEWHVFEHFDTESSAFSAINQLLRNPATRTQSVYIYETFIKVDGVVYRGWYYGANSDWLKKPEPFSNGVKVEMPKPIEPPTLDNPALNTGEQSEWIPEPRVKYPVVVKRFRITAEMRHDLAEGRAQVDYHKQSAGSTLVTSLVNTSIKASKVMWSPAGTQDIDGGQPAQLNLKIKDGQVWNKPMNAFHTPWPDGMLLNAIEFLVSSNAVETNQVAWAVNNKKDTRKTAAEIKAAEQQQSQLNSTDALVFSIFLREVFEQAWPIIKSFALQGQIPSFLAEDPNRDETIKREYEIKPAGDIDFIEKQQRLSDIQQDLPMFQGSPLGTELTKEYIRLRYPEKYAQWSKLLDQQDTAKQLVQALGGALEEAVTQPDGMLKPEFKPEAQNLEILKQNVQQFLAPAAAQ